MFERRCVEVPEQKGERQFRKYEMVKQKLERNVRVHSHCATNKLTAGLLLLDESYGPYNVFFSALLNILCILKSGLNFFTE